MIQIRVIGAPEKGLRGIFQGYLSLSLVQSWSGQPQVTEVEPLSCWPEGRVSRVTEEAGGRSGRQPSLPLFYFPSLQAPPAPLGLPPYANYLLQGCYTLSFTFFLVEYGIQHTQLVLVLEAKKKVGG